MTEQAYTVVDGERVREKLSLNHTPVGLYVISEGTRQSCKVLVQPKTSETRTGIQVSNKTLSRLLNTESIKVKEI